jgi:hypothetical protein
MIKVPNQISERVLLGCLMGGLLGRAGLAAAEHRTGAGERAQDLLPTEFAFAN